MNKQSFLNRNPAISTFIIFIYMLTIYRMIEFSLTFSNNTSTFIIYYIFLSFIVFIYSNIIFRILKHDC